MKPAKPRIAGTVLALLIPATAAAAQEPDTTAAASFDSAQAIRAALEMPPANPPFDAVDLVALPVRVVTFPLVALGTGLAEAAGAIQEISLPTGKLLRTLDRAGLSPFIGAIGPHSGIGAGMRFDKLDPVFLETAFSITGSQRHRAGLLLPAGGGRLESAYTYQRNAQIRFWGIGPDTDEEDETDFLWDISEIAADAAIRLGRVGLSAGTGFEDNRVGRGFNDARPDLQDVVDADTLFGLDDRTNYLRFDIGGELDLTRMEEGLQRRGVLLRGSSWLYLGTDGTDSDFHRFRGSAAGFVPLNLRQSLVVVLMAETNRGDSGRGVPFTHLATLGDDQAGRAYPSGRFRDRDMGAVMVEWRYEIWRELHSRGRAEGFIFFDDAAVKRNLDDIEESDLHESYGFGLRGVWGGRLLGLAYLAFGEEGARLQATFSWAY